MNKEAELYQKFVDSLKEPDSDSHTHLFIRKTPKNPYHIITAETTMIREIKDIRDELNILKAVMKANNKSGIRHSVRKTWRHSPDFDTIIPQTPLESCGKFNASSRKPVVLMNLYVSISIFISSLRLVPLLPHPLAKTVLSDQCPSGIALKASQHQRC